MRISDWSSDVCSSDLVLAKGYGFADVASRKAVDPATTLFRPGSVSKLFTWTAVMQQLEAGNPDLDKDINDYLELPIPTSAGQPITLRNITTPTARFKKSIRQLFSNHPTAHTAPGAHDKTANTILIFTPRHRTHTHK